MRIRRSKSSVTAILASTAIGLFFLLPAAAQEKTVELSPAQEAQEYAAINAELERVAKEIASLLQHPGFRGQLRGEINGAKTNESILVLDKFLAKVAKQKKAPPGLDKARGASDKASQRIKNSTAWALDGIDLYFPVEDHKAKWKGNEDLLVAYSPVTDEASVKAIIGFSVKTQQKVTLDPTTPPATPVLIVAPEEHDNHELPVASRGMEPSPAEQEESQDVSGIEFIEGDAEDSPVLQEDGNSFVGLRRMYMRDDKEPWSRGKPEVKVFFGHKKGSYCQSKYTWYSGTTLERFDYTNTWKTTWYGTPPYGSYCQSGTNNYSNNTCFYFDNTYDNKMVLYIYEQDGGSRREKLYTLYSGVTCSWSYYSGDDYMDSGIMYRNNFPFNYDQGHNMGNVSVLWHKVH
jgi:hypothetical protein